jgi:plasmid stabilization system protein ParE
VARLEIAGRADADLDRLFEFLAEQDLAAARAVKKLLFEGLGILVHHPLMGRPAEEDMRELVISRGKSGYVALYQYLEAEDVVLVLAIRHQREAGFGGGHE